LKEAHDSKIGGHMSIEKTIKKLKSQYYWKDMYRDVKRFVEGCNVCQIHKRKRGEMNKLCHLEKGGIWQDIAIDFIGPFYIGYEKVHVLVIIDMFSKFIETHIVKNTNSEHIKKVLCDTFMRYGIPKSILSDNSSNLISKVIKDTYRDLGIYGKNITPYNPKGNGIVERVNGTLKMILRKNLSGKNLNRKILSESTFAYNTTKHKSTGYSPYYVLYNREPTLPLKSLIEGGRNETIKEHVERSKRNRERTDLEVRSRLDKRDFEQDRYLKKKRKVDFGRKFDVGEFAWIYDEKRKDKLKPFYNGPVTIKKRMNDYLYLVESKEGEIRKVNIRKLTKYKRDYLPLKINNEKEVIKEEKIEEEIKNQDEWKYVYINIYHKINDKRVTEKIEENISLEDDDESIQSEDLDDYVELSDPEDDIDLSNEITEFCEKQNNGSKDNQKEIQGVIKTRRRGYNVENDIRELIQEYKRNMNRTELKFQLESRLKSGIDQLIQIITESEIDEEEFKKWINEANTLKWWK